MTCFACGAWPKRTCSIQLARKEKKKVFFRFFCVEFLFRYKLEDTGQGMQRVQSSPRVAKVGKKKDRDEPLFVCSFFFSKAMRDLLFRTQTKLGSWVGSSVVHLGDKNVPNALMFLDKLRFFLCFGKKKKTLIVVW